MIGAVNKFPSCPKDSYGERGREGKRSGRGVFLRHAKLQDRKLPTPNRELNLGVPACQRAGFSLIRLQGIRRGPVSVLIPNAGFGVNNR